MRYSRGDISSVIAAAREIAARSSHPRFVYARAGGFAIDRELDPFGQAGYRVDPGGRVELTVIQ